MRWFRFQSALQTTPHSHAEIREIIRDAIRPGQFFAAQDLNLTWDHRLAQTVFWELFRGRALDHTQTRARQSFESWNVCEGSPADEPLLSVKLDLPGRQIHVTRSVLCHAFESYSEGGAVLSRETVRRIRELVGTIDLDRLPICAEVHDELIALVFLAVVGASRLPLTSLEAPLPAFSLGQFAYCHRPDASDVPITRIADWIAASLRADLAGAESSRLLEFAIRAANPNNISEVAESFAAQWIRNGQTDATLLDLLRDVFNNIALSPYTDFVSKSLQLLRCLTESGRVTAADEADFLTHLLRQLGRHLTAFDLVRFHHRGANYPDALMVDEIVTHLHQLIDTSPALFLPAAGDDVAELRRKRLRRRGLRHGWLIRRQYRSHPVPDSPTSPGENSRVLPAPFVRIPDEQITNIGERTRRLFTDDPPLSESNAVREALRQSVADLSHSEEQLELGKGLFLDRPFGFAKKPGEPDLTTMLSHEAFSRNIALSRLALLRELGPLPEVVVSAPMGISWQGTATHQRPGVVSVQDAQLASDDFVYLRTTRRAVRDLLAAYDLPPQLNQWLLNERCLILPAPETPAELCIFDLRGQEQWRLRMDASQGFVCRAGTETLNAPLVMISPHSAK
jgi:hypothetical protein